MRRRTILIIASVAAVVIAGIAFTVWRINTPSYGTIANNCVAALKERAHGDKAKPAACDGLKQDDYDALLMSQIMGDLGWTDEDGNFDKNRMLDSVTETP